MWRITAGLVMIILLVLFGASAVFAQDVTPEPTADVVGEVVVDDVVGVLPTYEERATTTLRDAVIAILAAVGVTIGTITVILSRTSANVTALALEKLYSSVPSYLQPSMASALEGGVGRLKEYAKTTPYTWDDDYVAELEKLIDPIVKNRISQLVAQVAELKKQGEAPQ